MEVLLEQIEYYIEIYGVWLIILIGILHPFITFPPHIFALTVALSVLGIVNGYSALIVGNLIGIFMFYPIISRLRRNKIEKNEKNTIIGKTFKWIKTEPAWKHAIVLGVPLMPTQPIKYMLPLSGVSYKRYLGISISSYIFIYIINSLLYFGVLSFITDEIPQYVGVIFILLFVIIVYFGKQIFKKSELNKQDFKK